ncbi:DUF2793 domain-containing protein [Roseicyclus sp. F158]|uniref:DUF2793 domain-containing protein n=1 Tax=Tropicimonas omnivorans TaxID=3075590 RepID=A0ABU3DIV6_9RHOB|nr:DUF2793 domain-containing protein [Roseicyclus sp. F158]MDT0683625.1 DUF2793 domain-containing protein [Roseicyclus sp. F158]
MSDTPNMSLPFLAPSQAQKHVTVNEALMRLDALSQLTLVSRAIAMPPNTAQEGECYGVPPGATGPWAGHGGEIAVRSNGGWVFAVPRAGWRAWDASAGQIVVHDGGGWTLPPAAGMPGDAGLRLSSEVTECSVTAGGAQGLPVFIPAEAMVIACSARVTGDLGASLTGWSLGTQAEATKFGAGMGPLTGSYARGVLGTPQTFYDGAQIWIAPEGGSFDGGTLRVALHLIRVDLPAA